ncbi:MAG: hypothetical protein KatS3mg011_0083 [Acidimicrobiia bacterium]|nr:MAG: hypothetical protein KatS3mg011_0083 [Acidimicrobiia bacterium]
MIVVALALLHRVPWPVLGLAAGAYWWPAPTAVIVGVLSLRSLRSHPDRTAPDSEILVALASELRAGQSLRAALAAVGEGHPRFGEPARLAAQGRPMAEVADAVETALGDAGRLAAAAFRLAAEVGGAPARLFEDLAVQVLDSEELDRERRAATAPALLQGMVVGGLPLLLLVWMLADGRLAALAASSLAGAVIVTVGSSLTLAGVASTAYLVRRATR